MINGKYSYLLKIKSKEDSDKLSGLIKRITGKDVSKEIDKFIPNIPNKPPVCSGYLEISNDLLDFKNTTLNAFCSHIGYPAYKNFISKLDEFIDWYENEYLITKNLEIIKHIPHASLEFPKELDRGGISLMSLNKYNLKMSDVGIDYLFKDIRGIEIKAQYSRLFCDVEKYKDDEKEPMAKFGQGYMYTKTYDGEPLIRFRSINEIDCGKFIDEYYDAYHAKLTTTVKEELEKGKDVLILDCHSYSDELANSIGKEGPYPDICIGINKDFDNEPLLNLVIKKIKEKGYTYQINFPYEGSIMPQNLDLTKYKNKVYSIMIEVNKRIYL